MRFYSGAPDEIKLKSIWFQNTTFLDKMMVRYDFDFIIQFLILRSTDCFVTRKAQYIRTCMYAVVLFSADFIGALFSKRSVHIHSFSARATNVHITSCRSNTTVTVSGKSLPLPWINLWVRSVFQYTLYMYIISCCFSIITSETSPSRPLSFYYFWRTLLFSV